LRIQYHPASGKRTVLSWELSAAKQSQAAAVMFLIAALLAGFPLVFSTVLARWQRREAESEVAVLNLRRKEALDLATSALRETRERLESDSGQLGRIAFLYDLPAVARSVSAFPRPAGDGPARLEATETELDFLRGVLRKLSEVEARHADWPAESPSVSPVSESALVPTGRFGWEVSRLTGQREFLTGIDFASPAGHAVSAPADGVVRWAGTFPIRPGSPYGHLGRIVAIRHGDRAVTIFGYLESTEVGRGQIVRRGDRIGAVGMSPWVAAPRLRFEVWLDREGGAVPIDPRLAMLNVSGPEIEEALRLALRGAPRNFPELPAEFR
jgi:murein DD-endopeptidase MepM/ murein hydrolase activator NlpD